MECLNDIFFDKRHQKKLVFSFMEYHTTYSGRFDCSVSAAGFLRLPADRAKDKSDDGTDRDLYVLGSDGGYSTG